MLLITSHDRERSRSWPQYIRDPLPGQQLKIWTCLQWNVYRKWLHGDQTVTRLMTSCDPKRCHETNMFRAQYLGRAGDSGSVPKDHQWWRPVVNRMVMWQMLSNNLKRSSHDPNMFTADYLDNDWRQIMVYNAAPTENRTIGIKWSRAQRRHITLNEWMVYLVLQHSSWIIQYINIYIYKIYKKMACNTKCSR